MTKKTKKSTEPTTGPELEPHQIIIRPLVTEKGVHYTETANQYAFEVSTLANKTMIRHAVETLFDVKVAKVATQNRRGKYRRYRFKYGRTKNWKRAIVKLKPDFRIELY